MAAASLRAVAKKAALDSLFRLNVMRAGLSHQEHALRPEKAASGRFFTIQRLAGTGDQFRFSCVVSKKVAQKAVDRNRVRRQARAAFRHLALSGLFVIHVKKPALSVTFQELREEVGVLAKKLGSSS